MPEVGEIIYNVMTEMACENEKSFPQAISSMISYRNAILFFLFLQFLILLHDGFEHIVQLHRALSRERLNGVFSIDCFFGFAMVYILLMITYESNSQGSEPNLQAIF